MFTFVYIIANNTRRSRSREWPDLKRPAHSRGDCRREREHPQLTWPADDRARTCLCLCCNITLTLNRGRIARDEVMPHHGNGFSFLFEWPRGTHSAEEVRREGKKKTSNSLHWLKSRVCAWTRSARHGAQVGHERKRRHHGRTEGSKRERESVSKTMAIARGFAVSELWGEERRAFRECFGECVLEREFLVVALWRDFVFVADFWCFRVELHGAEGGRHCLGNLQSLFLSPR